MIRNLNGLWGNNEPQNEPVNEPQNEPDFAINEPQNEPDERFVNEATA
jgi:hypothetical protein